MHLVDEPSLVVMREMIAKLWRELGVSGFEKNEPDGRMTPFLCLRLKPGKTPTTETRILSMFHKHSGFDLWCDLALGLVRR